jgi:hypothetical protein
MHLVSLLIHIYSQEVIHSLCLYRRCRDEFPTFFVTAGNCNTDKSNYNCGEVFSAPYDKSPCVRKGEGKGCCCHLESGDVAFGEVPLDPWDYMYQNNWDGQTLKLVASV